MISRRMRRRNIMMIMLMKNLVMKEMVTMMILMMRTTITTMTTRKMIIIMMVVMMLIRMRLRMNDALILMMRIRMQCTLTRMRMKCFRGGPVNKTKDQEKKYTTRMPLTDRMPSSRQHPDHSPLLPPPPTFLSSPNMNSPPKSKTLELVIQNITEDRDYETYPIPSQFQLLGFNLRNTV